MQMPPGGLLDALDAQHRVFKDYWPLADANSFRANTFNASSSFAVEEKAIQPA